MDRSPFPSISRRALLRQTACGFGTLGLSSLLSAAAATKPENPLAPKQPQFAPRAKRIIFLFMHGGPSSIDTFDYKPRLQKDTGKPLPFAKPRVQFSQTGNLLASPWKFAQHGQSGAWISELFPHVAACADDLCVVKS